ncbi:cytochrome c oxidase subunit II [Longimicrobium terrae]|uniref:Cytochrome c oxidase subunit 2 n=1 Tax=Longimicrobium terrae TaxID=1639882 RepID=A0A841H6Q5_9BACT|nr:cytochrome c oxidase subunit II [Longimicrobium terrae]MBB4638183.1 cytochrome c oxidase subunit 2 [Longimicrobium terrae]MBB6073658.1 cytochrome c oxidase subunit 2 [Longimicrobium terrae]NNC30336.1 cytochrome c oxidase subunit II [Longimicrobium terrae]
MKSVLTAAGSLRRLRPGRALRSGLPALLPVLLLLASACGDDHLTRFPQTTFAPATEMASEQMWLFHLTMWMGIVVGLLTFGLMGWILWKFRYRPGGPEAQQFHGNTTLEIAWTLLPALIVAVIAVFTVRAIFITQPEPPANALNVRVIGKQWWWEFQYAVGRDTIITANEIHVPVGQPVQLLLESDNVLHSFWVPQMAGKRDLITNRVNRLVFTPREPGVYMGQCAEFCGDSHALMKMRLIAHTPDGFRQWLENEARPAVEPTDSASAVAVGKKLVTQGVCAGCHVIKGTPMVGRTGPVLTHFGRRRTLAAGIMENNAANLHSWIRNAPAVKPGSKMPQLGGDVQNALSDEQISYIVAYLQSLQ